jgi:hypothetical protein
LSSRTASRKENFKTKAAVELKNKIKYTQSQNFKPIKLDKCFPGNCDPGNCERTEAVKKSKKP